MSDIENKIAPYMNNYGQKIIDQNLDFGKIDKIFQIISEIIKKSEKKFDPEFIELVENTEKAKNFFTYIELFKISKQEDIKRSINYLYFRYIFNLASNEKKEFNFPPYLLIEPNAACNLKCPMCFQIDKTFTRKPFMGIMKWDLFKKIVDEANEIGVGAITLASRGEPLMHPKISEMLYYISEKKIYLN